jgi:hypothetical protein
MLKKSHAPTLLTFLLCCLLSISNIYAQSQATSGNIEGRVLDPNGAAVPNMSITATNQGTGLEKTVTTDSEGLYRFVLLPPGTYTVRAAAASGFDPIELRNVVVTVGGQTTLDINLSIKGSDVFVTVNEEAQAVETTRTSVSSLVNERAIQNLPVNGRNFLDFATLTPGVIRDPTRAGDLSVGGQKGTLNSLQVDGVDNNNTFFGQSTGRTGTRPPYQFSEESVQEFQVNQNGFNAEFGRAGGAVINVITKSGTNDFHGGLFEYFRDESLNSNTPQLTARGRKRPPSQINQFGGRLGGPIVRNRAFFFFTYDGQRSTIPQFIDSPSFFTQPASIQAALAPRLTTYEIGRNQDVFLGKGDILINNSNQLSLRFNRQNFTGKNNENSGPLSAQEHSGNSIARTTTFSGTLASTLSQTVVNEFRFQFARDAEPGEANSDLPEAIIQTTNGNLSLGRNNFSPRETTVRRVQFVDNINYVRGRHNMKFGVDINRDRIFNFFPGLFSGSYTFPSYSAFTSNTATNITAISYTQNFAGPNTNGATTEPDSTDYALFAQDSLRVTPKLTLDLGVRYDYQKLAQPPIRNTDPTLLAAGFDTSTRPDDKNNIAPRVGFSYATDERTVIRGGYGIFYGRTPAIMLGTAHNQNGISITGVTLTQAALVNLGLSFPNNLAAVPSGVGVTRPNPSLFLFSDNFTQPYVQQARLGFERELVKNLSLSVTYLFYKGVHLARTRDANLFPAVATNSIGADNSAFTVLRFPVARPLPNFARVSLFESNGNSRYNALAFEAKRRLTNRFQFIASYTFSKAKDDKPDSTAVVVGADDVKIVTNPLDARSDFGTSDLDLPHRFVFSPVYDTGEFKSDNRFLRALLSDYNFSSIIQFQSGFVYSATVNGDTNRDGNRVNDIAPGTRRNQFRTPATYQFDARVTRSIQFTENMRLRLILEGFNLFNRTNVATNIAGFFAGVSASNTNSFTSTTTGGVETLRFNAPATNFGTASSFLTGRQLQLAIKFDF